MFKGLQSLLNSQAITSTAQQMSSQGLRMLLVNAPTIVMNSNIIIPTANLLRSPHLQVQYEGYELLQELVKRENLQDLIIVHLIEIMRNVVNDGSEEKEASMLNVMLDVHRRTATSDARMQQWGMSLEDQKEKENIIAAYIQQAYASKLIGVLVASSPEMAEKMVSFQSCSALLNVLANSAYPESQKYAASTLLV